MIIYFQDTSSDDDEATFIDALEVLSTFDTKKVISAGMLYCM